MIASSLCLGSLAVLLTGVDGSRVARKREIESSNVEASTWGLNKIGADARSRRGASVTIFVMDTGVRATHHEFGGRVSAAGFDSTDAVDSHGHGTHSAGIAAGATFGVAPAATIKAVKIAKDPDDTKYLSLNIDNALVLMRRDYRDVRPAVVSIGLWKWGTEDRLHEAFTEAVDDGLIVVVPAGDDDFDSCRYSPAYAPLAITVGSTTSMDSRSKFSNYGRCTDIWAPGSDITSASQSSDTGSATLSGTSIACSHVSGAAALILEGDPSLSSRTVLAQLLKNSALGYVSGLEEQDVNALLYVGKGGA